MCGSQCNMWARHTDHFSHRCPFTRTDSDDICMCSVVYALSRKFSQFLLSKRYYIVQDRRKNTFLRHRDCRLLCCHSALLLWPFIFVQRVFKVFQSTFSPVTVQFRCVTPELCNFDAKQSTLCCFDGFRTLYCCINADVSFRNYYHSNLSRSFSKASITVILLCCSYHQFCHFVHICLHTVSRISLQTHIYCIKGLIQFTFHLLGGPGHHYHFWHFSCRILHFSSF